MTWYIGARVTIPTPFGDDVIHGTIMTLDYYHNKACILSEGKTILIDIALMKPESNFRNFQRLILDWDDDFRKSDDPKVYEQGLQIENELALMIKTMTAADRYTISKIAYIHNNFQYGKSKGAEQASNTQ